MLSCYHVCLLLTFGVFGHAGASPLIELITILALASVIVSPNRFTFAVITASEDVMGLSMLIAPATASV